MALFKKNPNEVNYPNGKKPFSSVIKNEGSPNNMMWKVPYEDFNQHSKVIVAENEDALFYKNGVVEEIFTSGEYDLSTGNYPFLSRIRNVITDGVSIYNCRIYYVNKAHKLDNKWGTGSPIQCRDRYLNNIPTKITARGAFTVQVVDSKKFFLKYVGMNRDTVTPDDVIADFRGPVNQFIRDKIGNVIESIDDEVLSIISSKTTEIAERMRVEMEPIFDEYGMRMVNFYIEAMEILDTPERTEALKGRAEAARYQELGKTNVQMYQTARSYDVMETAAGNEGMAGAAMGAGMGLGFGASAGANMYQMSQNNLNTQAASQPAGTACPACGAQVPQGSNFCPGCGNRMTAQFCTSCGAQIPPGSRFCPGCGGRVQ